MDPQKIKSPILRQLHHILADGLRRIENDECDETEVYSMLNRFNAESKGFRDVNSTMTYDEAMRTLGMHNRTAFKRLCDKNKIKQVVMRNTKIGFDRWQIEDLALRIRQQNIGDGPK